jgi:hypothetical protein
MPHTSNGLFAKSLEIMLQGWNWFNPTSEHGADETSDRDDKNKLRYKGTDLDGLHFKGLAY